MLFLFVIVVVVWVVVVGAEKGGGRSNLHKEPRSSPTISVLDPRIRPRDVIVVVVSSPSPLSPFRSTV